MKILKLALLLTTLLAAPALLAPAYSQDQSQDDLSTPDAIALRNQILQLQSEVNALQSAQTNGSAIPAPVPQGGAAAPAPAVNSDLMASLVTRVAKLEDQVRTLNGEVDELTNQLKVQNQSFTKQIGDINFQLQGGATGATPAGATPAPGAPAGTTPPSASPDATAPQSDATPGLAPTGPNGLLTGTLGAVPAGQAPDQTQTQAAPPPPAAPTPADILQAGLAAYAKKNYTEAANDAKSVLAADRASAIGYDAQYLLARSLQAKHNWEDAAVAFDDTYKRARYGSHSQEAQIGEARALLDLGNNGAACGALGRLTKQYPNPHPDLVPTINNLRAKACGS